MIVNPDKFQAIFVRKNCRIKDSYALNIINQTINPENRINLLGIEINITLSFDQKNPNLYKKAGTQMRLEEFRSRWPLWKKKCFILSNFNSCPLVWHYRFSKSLKKNKKIQEEALRILYHYSTSNYKELLNKSSKETFLCKYLKLWIIWTSNRWK